MSPLVTTRAAGVCEAGWVIETCPVDVIEDE